MEFAFYAQTHVGRVRTENQDSIVASKENQLFIIADGMGGHQGGEVASQMAIDILQDKLKQKYLAADPKNIKKDIYDAYLTANSLIYNKGQNDLKLQGMGTTLCTMLIGKDNIAYIGNVGDSRLLLYRDNMIWQLTEDDTFIADQLKNALITEEKLSTDRLDSHILTKSVGFQNTLEPDIFQKKLYKGEKYLLCSDGLSGLVSTQQIQDILEKSSCEEATKQCIDEALSMGGSDNVSVIVVEIL